MKSDARAPYEAPKLEVIATVEEATFGPMEMPGADGGGFGAS